MTVTESDIKKLKLLYKIILNKKIRISINNLDNYYSKLQNLKVKILKDPSDEYCGMLRNRKLNIIHNVFYSYIYRLKIKDYKEVWHEAFIEYCLIDLTVQDGSIKDINDLSHNLQKRISINYNLFMTELEKKKEIKI